MGLFDFFRAKQTSTAAIAKDRLLIIVQQQRSDGNAPDFLPRLREELLEVIRKYVNVDRDAVQIEVEKDGNQERLALSVQLPMK